MHRILLYIIVLLSMPSFAQKTLTSSSVNTQWDRQKRVEHLDRRMDSTAWDIQMLVDDQKEIMEGDFGPFELGIFPEPKYHLLGKNSFRGLGSKGGQFKVNDKNIQMMSFFVGENTFNRERLDGKKDEVFFHVMILTDTIDTNSSIVISRNHPDYLGQGFIKTKSHKIDYLAFVTAENNAYAIINTRLFDLSFGKTILIAPQKDGTLRSLQLPAPQLTSDSVTDYTEKLIKTPEVETFFLNKQSLVSD